MRLPLLLAASLLAAAPSAAQPVSIIPGPDGGGWDYARVDPASGRLFVARANSVTVFDLAGGTPPRAIGALSRGHAVVPLGGDTLLATSGMDNSVRILDVATGRETARIAVAEGPDAATYDAVTGKAYVMDSKAGSVAVIDVATRKVAATVPLKAGLEFGALGGDHTLFVNNEDANEIETVDTRTDTAGAAIAMPGCEGPSGLAYDPKIGLLISACDNGKAAIVDARTHRLRALIAIGEGPDAVIVDGARHRAFIPCGKSGELDEIALDAPGGPKMVRRIPTEAGARTGALDPRDGAVYLPTAKLGPPPAPGQRGAVLPGTFHIVVVRPAAR